MAAFIFHGRNTADLAPALLILSKVQQPDSLDIIYGFYLWYVRNTNISREIQKYIVAALIFRVRNTADLAPPALKRPLCLSCQKSLTTATRHDKYIYKYNTNISQSF